MAKPIREHLSAIRGFVATPGVSRSVAALMAASLVLLFAANAATFLMIDRTSEFNQGVERSHQIRRAARTLLISALDAETGQRGFVLTGRPEFLEPYRQAVNQKDEVALQLRDLSRDDADLQSRTEALIALTDVKFRELDRTIDMVRAGRIGEAMAVIRAGEGRAQMDRLRAEIAAIDDIEESRLTLARERSEQASVMTVAANGVVGLMILLLAGISAWMIRRYVLELQAAREAVDQVNLGLEGKVQERTAALTRANDEIQRFAYIVSHDLRAPLVNVMGYTSELEQAGRAMSLQIDRIEAEAPATLEPDAVVAVREDVPEAIGFIRASTAKMDRLINAILKLSREGRRNLTVQPLDMTEIVQGIADSVRHQTEAADAEILVSELPGIDSDRLAIEQVFGNLIDNAVKYLDAGRPGRIAVTGDETAGAVVYRVSDNGRGIAERDHERIFELFRRSGRQDRAGEGLGLAFVRNSVRRLGGDIELESELGKGSTFVLKFPKRLSLTDAGDSL